MKLGAFVKLLKHLAQKEDIVDFFKDAAGLVPTEQTGSGNSSGEDTLSPTITLAQYSDKED